MPNLYVRRWALAAMLCGLSVRTAVAAPPDAWITTKAKIALMTADGVSAAAVNVDTVDGLVTLHGKVESAAEKAKAETAVKRIDGVQGVRNLLQVVPARREEAVGRSDADLKRAVERALETDRAFADVSVQSVNAGVVLLEGRVSTLGEHLRAIETASSVPGVRRVASEIQSPDKLADAEIYTERGPGAAKAGVSDLWITSAVKFRLLADERTPGTGINVDTRGGNVTLFGIVESQQAKAAAAEEARKVSGVRSVANELQVVAAGRQDAVDESDERVEQRVEDALERQTELRGADIDVEVHNGIARLTGTVPNETQRVRAAAVARTASGVRQVRDDLRVTGN